MSSEKPTSEGEQEKSHCVKPEHWSVVDLALCHYPGKWRVAKEWADKSFQCGTYEWWEKARLTFLELGGEYIHQLQHGRQAHYTQSCEWGSLR